MSLSHLQASEHKALADIMSDSFGTEVGECLHWIERSDPSNWRVLHHEGQLACGLMLIPMAQWFGGRAVSMTGIAGVGVGTAARGHRLGQALMRGALDEMHAKSQALSVLYGSTTSFYRRCGYERAGSRFMASVSPRDISVHGGTLSTRLLTEADSAQVQALQASAITHHGALVRGPYVWSRLRQPRGQQTQSFGFFRGSTLEGYATILRLPQGHERSVLEATDVVLTTPDALTAFLGLLAAHRTFFTQASWPSAPDDPVLMSMPEPWAYKLELHEHWMLRIVHLESALEQRGYPRNIQETLCIEIEDVWLSTNAGPWTLHLKDGSLKVQRGGTPDTKIDIGALASLYTGFSSPESLALTGRLQGSKEAQKALGGLFAGPAPHLNDFF